MTSTSTEILNGARSTAEHPAGKSTDHHRPSPFAVRQPWELYALIGTVIAESALITLGNLPHMSAWLLALLAVGVGQALLLPATAAWLTGLGVVVAWVLLRQAAGIWIQPELFQSLLELAGLSLSVVLAIRFRQIWQHQQEELQELRELEDLLVAGEVGTGLLPREVAELRLEEEIDRARQFQRPLGLLLVEIDALPKLEATDVQFRQVYQAITRQLTSASLVHDIPFRVGQSRIGLILPERSWDDLYDDAESIVNALHSATFLDREEQPQPAHDYIQLTVGLGTYQGERVEEIDLMGAAEDSLDISRDLAGLGEVSVSAYAMPAAGVVEPKLVLGEEEEASS
ncbi:MAG: hypothetical protein MAG451_02442 [Anaerolineales bacterium]|nr:hypothetical protein [Anaerolineales bacterium]